MSPTTAPVSSTPFFQRATRRETAALLGLAWLVPMAVHVIPWSGSSPLGAHLLPMFWATFVAAYLFGARLGVIVGLAAPILNLLVTGLPAWKFLSVLSVELVLFALVSTWAVRVAPRFFLIAPLAYVAAKIGSTGVQSATVVFGDIGRPADFFLGSLATGAAGLAMLLAVNALLVRCYPRGKNAGVE